MAEPGRVPLNEVVTFDAITSSPFTGAAADADSTPTFAVYEDTTDTDIGVGGNMTKRTSLTGNYRASFTASAANGFELGKWYNVISSATVGGVAGKCVSMTFMCTAAEAVAGVAPVDLTYILGTLLTETAGQIAGGFKKFFNIATPAATMDHGVLVDTVTTVTNQLTAAQIATGVWQDATAGDFTASASVGKSVMNGVALGTGLTVANLTNAPTNGDLTAAMKASVTAAVPSAATIAQAVWDALTSALTTVGSIGKKLADWSIGTAQTGDSYAIVNSGTFGNSALKTLIDAIQADLPTRITKNVALAAFPFFMADSTDHVSGKTGLTITATRSLDGGAFASCANSASEIGGGWYKISLAATDTNANTIAVSLTATGADPINFTIVTEPT